MNLITKLLLSGILSLGGLISVNALTQSTQTVVNETEVQTITLEEAKEIALNKVQGTFVSSTADDDDYTIVIEKDDVIYEVEVNKFSGTIEDVDTEAKKVESTSQISETKAKEIALKKINGTVVSVENDEDDYTVTIEKGNYIYEVEVNKYSGKIEDVDKEEKKVQSASQISETKAKELALKKVNGTIISVENDEDDYTVTIEKGNYIYEVEVNKYSGKIEDVDKEIKKTQSSSKITKEKAKEIALNQVNGKVISVEYDDDDHEYSVEVIMNNIEYEITIDAGNGKVLEVEKD